MVLKEKFQNKEKLKILLILLLLSFLSFGLGLLAGSKIFTPNPIIINGNLL